MKPIFVFLVFLAAPVFLPAHGEDWEDYGPFKQGDAVVRPVTLSVQVSYASKVQPCPVVPPGSDRYPRFELAVQDEDASDEGTGGTLAPKGNLLLWSKKGKLAFALPLKGDLEVGGWGNGISLDLNGDGRPDYVLAAIRRDVKSEEAAQNPVVLVFLSGSHGYKAWEINCSAQMDLSDFLYVLGGNPRPDLLWMETVNDPDGQQVEAGHYMLHVYNWIRFQDQGPVLADSLDPRFPMIISEFPGSRRQNHSETHLLNAEQKQNLLSAHHPRWVPLSLSKTKG